MPQAETGAPAPGYDRRITPARADLAADHLRGILAAPRYVPGTDQRVRAPLTPLRPRPDPTAPQDTELRHGEAFRVYDAGGGWSWGQSGFDGYVGWVRSDALALPGPMPTHRVITRFAPVHATPDYKRVPGRALPMGALVSVADITRRWARLQDGGWIAVAQLAPLDTVAAPDPVASALGLVGVPYVWGGRTPLGLDCSGLVQLVHELAGTALPRDSDQQFAATTPAHVFIGPSRGDLVFFPGHVAIALDAGTVVHANALAMAVAVEPLVDLCTRIARDAGLPDGTSPVTGIRHARRPA